MSTEVHTVPALVIAPSAAEIWEAALGELQLQMTKATFDTRVRPTRAISYANGTLVVGVHSPYAKEWLENRLNAAVQRTVCGIVGHAVETRFIVQNALRCAEPHAATEPPQICAVEPQAQPQPGDVIVELLESPLVPFLQVQKYALWFWQPLLGVTAFATWLMLRTLDKENVEWGKRHRISVDLIAQTLGVDRQRITGVKRGSSWQAGAFDILNRERLAKIEPIGTGRDLIYWARVLNAVPLLTPQQADRLPPLLQERHTTFLHDFSVDAERWEQIELPTLVTDFSCAPAQGACAK